MISDSRDQNMMMKLKPPDLWSPNPQRDSWLQPLTHTWHSCSCDSTSCFSTIIANSLSFSLQTFLSWLVSFSCVLWDIFSPLESLLEKGVWGLLQVLQRVLREQPSLCLVQHPLCLFGRVIPSYCPVLLTLCNKPQNEGHFTFRVISHLGLKCWKETELLTLHSALFNDPC